MKKVVGLFLTIIMVLGVLTSVPLTASAATFTSNMVGNFDPYSLLNAEVADVIMGGNTYKDAIKCRMGYTGTSDGHTSFAIFNFNGKYESLSFSAGYISGATYNAGMVVLVDGKAEIVEELYYNALPKKYEISLEGVNEVFIYFSGQNGYDGMWYGIGAINAVSQTGEKAPNHYTSNMVNNCEPYFLRNGQIADIAMGGDTYDDAIKLRMGYTGSSDGHTGEAMFNFNGMYESLSFSVGYISGVHESAQFTILVDGVEIENAELYATNLPQKYTIPLKDVHQVVLRLEGNNGYDGMWYGIGGVNLKSNGVTQNIIMLTKEISLAKDNPTSYAKAVVVPPDAINPEIKWSSSDPDVATVNQKGLVTAVSGGTATITATTVDGGYSDTCTVKVDLPFKPAIPKLTKIQNTTSGVKVTWDAAENAQNYSVYRKVYDAKTNTWSDWSMLVDGVTDTFYVDETAKSGKNYIYTVKGNNEVGYGKCESGLKICYLATPKLTKIANDENGVQITWDTVKGADSYRVYRKISTGEYEYIGSTTSTSYTDKNAPAGKTCRYRIRAKNETGYSVYSASLAIKHIDEPVLKSIENSAYGVLIKWDKVTGAEKYNVYRKVSGGEYKYIGATSNTYYTDKTAESGTKYYYAIRAKRDDSISSQSASLSKYYLADPTLNTPTSTTKGIGLRWTQVEGAEGYMVYRRTADGSYKRITTEEGISNVTFRDTTAKKGTKYYYKVKAYKSKTYSAYSNTKAITDKY